MNYIGHHLIFGNDILLTDQHIQAVVTVLAEERLEIVAKGVGIAELVAILIGKNNGRFSLILSSRLVRNIVGCGTIITLGIYLVGIVAKFCLKLQVLVELPSKGTRHIESGAHTSLVIVTQVGDRIIERRTCSIIIVCLCRNTRNRERSILDGITQTLVGAGCAFCLIGTTAIDLGLRPTSLEVKRNCLHGFGIELEAEVVTYEIRHLHDSLVVHTGIAESILHLFATTIDVQVVIESMTDSAIHDILIVIGCHVVVHIQVAKTAKVRLILIRHVVLQTRQFVLPVGIIAGAENIERIGNFLP